LTIDNLNSSVFLPRKDPSDQNLMYPSPLLFSDGTVVLIDETQMAEGSLIPAGIKSFQALRSLSQNQILPIECEYFTTKLSTDAPIILCSTSPSTLNANGGRFLMVHIGEDAVEGIMQTDIAEISDESADTYRRYLALARNLDVTMDPEVAKAAENEFVSRRQDSTIPTSSMITVEDFHSWLVLARLIAKSRGLRAVTMEVWVRAMELERYRKQTLSKQTCMPCL
jgi:hypothetical protein